MRQLNDPLRVGYKVQDLTDEASGFGQKAGGLRNEPFLQACVPQFWLYHRKKRHRLAAPECCPFRAAKGRGEGKGNQSRRLALTFRHGLTEWC